MRIMTFCVSGYVQNSILPYHSSLTIVVVYTLCKERPTTFTKKADYPE